MGEGQPRMPLSILARMARAFSREVPVPLSAHEVPGEAPVGPIGRGTFDDRKDILDELGEDRVEVG